MRGDRTNHLLFVMASLGRELQLNASYLAQGVTSATCHAPVESRHVPRCLTKLLLRQSGVWECHLKTWQISPPSSTPVLHTLIPPLLLHLGAVVGWRTEEVLHGRWGDQHDVRSSVTVLTTVWRTDQHAFASGIQPLTRRLSRPGHPVWKCVEQWSAGVQKPLKSPGLPAAVFWAAFFFLVSRVQSVGR